MLRSSTSCRVSDEFSVNSLHAQSPSSNPQDSETFPLNQRLLPIYNPNSRAAKNETSRLRSAENAVHIIPFILVLSGFMLWLFSGNQGYED